MIIDNKDFWGKTEIIKTQDQTETHAPEFEIFMLENAKKRYSKQGELKNICVYGCGTGRELNEIYKYLKPEKIVASDIAENMILKCNENLKTWGINDCTETLVGNAVELKFENQKFELVVMFNNMLTYVTEKSDRLKIFDNSYTMLKEAGSIVGMVHHQLGTPSKTLYFKFKSLFSIFLKDNVGKRNTGFKGMKIPGYYFTKKNLKQELSQSGFKNIEIYSLEEFNKSLGASYDRKKGYNNLIFIASK